MARIFACLVACFLLVIVAGGCGSGNDGPGSATVEARNDISNATGFSFQSPVTVRSGATVRWHNGSSATHDVTWDAQTPNSSPGPGPEIDDFGPGTTSNPWVAPIVTTQTTYPYHCGIHGAQMNGQIIVNP